MCCKFYPQWWHRFELYQRTLGPRWWGLVLAVAVAVASKNGFGSTSLGAQKSLLCGVEIVSSYPRWCLDCATSRMIQLEGFGCDKVAVDETNIAYPVAQQAEKSSVTSPLNNLMKSLFR